MQDKFSLNNRNLSFWESNVLSQKRDFIIVGAGLVGLSTSISLKEKFPDASVLLVDRATIPYGASTRNAGFGCFGSISEILSDLEALSRSEVEELISKRWLGLKALRERIGDDNLHYKGLGGFELFSQKQALSYDLCVDRISDINQLILNATGLINCFSIAEDSFGMVKYKSLIYNQYEGQLHPGLMMTHLHRIATAKGVKIQYGIDVSSYATDSQGITLSNKTKTINLHTEKLIITTNAFAPSLIDGLDLSPGRNQVLMTKPIKDLKIKGCFHFDQGYVYFRNFKGRLLIGGGRNVAMDEETTADFGLTEHIQNYLRGLLKEIIIPNIDFEEEVWWSGIIATGSSKKPIVKEISENIYLGVRLGGMGVAMGSLIGQELAQLV